MQTPLYKFLKSNGTSIYVLPGAQEDISASHQNGNYKMYFSKYVLVDFPKQNLVDIGGTQSSHIYWNFGSFSGSSVTLPDTYGDQIIESLRNYVANHEVVIRESRLNNTEYYYDNTALETTSEKIFFKWCKHLNVVDFEPALPDDEYFDNLTEFERKNPNDDTYFQEYLWKEREIAEFEIISYEGSISFDSRQVLQLTINGRSNFRAGDIIEIDGVDDTTPSGLADEMFGDPNVWVPVQIRVLEVSDDDNQLITMDFDSLVNVTPQTTATAKLVYHRIIQYIGEVNGVSNVQQANRAYTEVYAHVPDHTGRTPDILFRTIADVNYKPGLEFPIIPNQYQPEIIGGELFSSPIVSNPESYPGSYYGQFDNIDFIYEVANGDSLRRSGDYYGVRGDINDPVVNGSTIDGINIDFNTSHYVKMNIEDRSTPTFDQFNALEVNNAPPDDFEFNAILWYYTVEDLKGNRRTNLYGISFLDHPDNNPVPEEEGIRFPAFKKLVTNGSQDGTSYAFALNLNFNLTYDNPTEAYNPEAVNSIFSMNLYNEAMRRLSSVNDSFLNIIAEHSSLKDQILGMKQLLYSQTDFATINSRISNLEKLLKLYSTLQTSSSDTIEVEVVNETSPPTVRYNNIDRGYKNIFTYNSTDMYNASGIIPIESTIPQYKDFMIQVINNDEVAFDLSGENLKIILSSDLSPRQSVEVLISGTDQSVENKKLDIYIATINPLGLSSSNPESEVDTTPIETLIVGDIDLPVFYNTSTSQPNSAKTWKDFKFDIDFTKDITLLSNNMLELSLDSNTNITYNSIKVGDSLTLNNLFIGTNSVFDFSGQYIVEDVSNTDPQIKLNIANNADFVSYGEGSLPLSIHSASASVLSNLPFFSLNKGHLIKITRVSELDQIPVADKYLIDIRDLKY